MATEPRPTLTKQVEAESRDGKPLLAAQEQKQRTMGSHTAVMCRAVSWLQAGACDLLVLRELFLINV